MDAKESFSSNNMLIYCKILCWHIVESSRFQENAYLWIRCPLKYGYNWMDGKLQDGLIGLQPVPMFLVLWGIFVGDSLDRKGFSSAQVVTSPVLYLFVIISVISVTLIKSVIEKCWKYVQWKKNKWLKTSPSTCLPLVHAHTSQCEALKKAGAAEQDACLASTLLDAGGCTPRGCGVHSPIQTRRASWVLQTEPQHNGCISFFTGC